MTAVAPGNYKRQAAMLKALAHPTRLLIVDELACGERCVSELTRLARADMATVSRHLKLLKSVELLEDERRGSQVFYRLTARGERLRENGWGRINEDHDASRSPVGRWT